MKKIIFLFSTVLIVANTNAQDKYFTKTGKISFDATVPKSPENIVAVNKATTMVLDTKTGEMQFVVQMKGFEFERALMQEHFNENYVETTKFPKAEFKGGIQNNEKIVYTKDGSYATHVKGKLTMHGVTNDVETDGKITVSGGKISTSASFSALFADYNIIIPSVVGDKVAKSVKINVECALEALKKN